MTQMMLAEKADLSVGYLCDLEAGNKWKCRCIAARKMTKKSLGLTWSQGFLIPIAVISRLDFLCDKTTAETTCTHLDCHSCAAKFSLNLDNIWFPCAAHVVI